MYLELINFIAQLFPPGLEELVYILFACFYIFSIAGVIYAVIAIFNKVKGVLGFGRKP